MEGKKTITINVTPDIYKICCVLDVLEYLRIFGLVEGGLQINRNNLQTILRKGEELRYEKPDGYEAELILKQLLHGVCHGKKENEESHAEESNKSNGKKETP